jgi:prepilin-type N-terminal cleavage/methylation domain-containing protein/prepilin-type processing-associated H-X9-DG protein
MRRQRSFTLIELLVVVAIIAVLIAVLLPSLSEARAIAKQVACGNDLRQLGLANLGYIHDNHDYFPDATGADKDSEADDHFTGKTFYGPYLGNDIRVFLCPAGPAGGAGTEVTYVVNEFTFQQAQYHGYTNPLQLSRVRVPARVLLFRDWWATGFSAEDWPHLSGFWVTYLDVHRGGVNIAFMDNHLGYFKLDSAPVGSDWPQYRITMYPY